MTCAINSPSSRNATHAKGQQDGPNARRCNTPDAVDAQKKSLVIAYLLWFLAAHRFYLGRAFSAITFLLTPIMTTVLVADVSLGLAVWLVWVLIDLFLIPGMVRKYNIELIDRL